MISDRIFDVRPAPLLKGRVSAVDEGVNYGIRICELVDLLKISVYRVDSTAVGVNSVLDISCFAPDLSMPRRAEQASIYSRISSGSFAKSSASRDFFLKAIIDLMLSLIFNQRLQDLMKLI